MTFPKIWTEKIYGGEMPENWGALPLDTWGNEFQLRLDKLIDPWKKYKTFLEDEQLQNSDIIDKKF